MTNETCHIPIHFDEDGKPWKEYDDAEVNSIPVIIHGFSENGMFYKHNDDVQFRWSPTQLFKRPAPYVYGAKGERIHKDDTVWDVRTGQKATVTTVCKDDKTCVEVKIAGHLMDYEPSDLTLQEPDSLEKLRDDMRSFGEVGADCTSDCCLDYANRLTALIEKDA